MYLDSWMIVLLVLSFGFCAIWNRRRGYLAGGVTAIKALCDMKIITVTESGEILKVRDNG